MFPTRRRLLDDLAIDDFDRGIVRQGEPVRGCLLAGHAAILTRFLDAGAARAIAA